MANYNLAQLQALSRQAGWSENLIAKAAAIWMYESNGNPNAHNPNGENSWGLAQINLPFHPTMTVAKATDPITALTYAYKLYRARPDWGDWYNSNKKYEGTYGGTANQKATWLKIRNDSHLIYNGGGSVQNTASIQPVIYAGDNVLDGGVYADIGTQEGYPLHQDTQTRECFQLVDGVYYPTTCTVDENLDNTALYIGLTVLALLILG